MGPSLAIAAARATADLSGCVYVNKPVLRGQFHKYGAILYPPLLGLPLYMHAVGYRNDNDTGNSMNLPWMSMVFNFAVESIMIVSGTLHTYPWKTERSHQFARKLDFVTIFVAIASFYSSLGKILFAKGGRADDDELLLGLKPQLQPRPLRGGGERLFAYIEGTVWACAAVGGLTKWLFPDAPAFVNAGIFLIQGWAVLPLIPTLFRSATKEESIGLALGGMFVTLGALSYAFQWPKLLKHSVTTASGGDKKQKSKTTPTVSQRDILFGPHEMFHLGTILMFISFWYTMWMAIEQKGKL